MEEAQVTLGYCEKGVCKQAASVPYAQAFSKLQVPELLLKSVFSVSVDLTISSLLEKAVWNIVQRLFSLKQACYT